MPEHQQIQQSKKPDISFQKQATPVIQTPLSNPYSIIQRAKINPKLLTHADIMQLQRTIGNRAVGRLLSSIGSSSTAQQATVQRQEVPEDEEPLQGKMAKTVQRQKIPEEEEPLQGKMIGTIQRQEIPEEEEPLQGRMIETVQRQEIPEEEEPLQGKMIGTIQRQEIPEEEEPLQGKFEDKPEIACPSCFAASIVQKQEIPEEEEPLQGKMIGTVQRQEIPEEEPLQSKRENNTGMPDNLKAGVESLSGIDMSDVKVYYNSSKPADVGALAYTQGTDIHVALGQEKHLPHEAWHVVQQAKGRVRPTMQLKDGVPVNDDEGLEHEADVMGVKALQMRRADQVTFAPIAQAMAVEAQDRGVRQPMERAFTSGQDIFLRQGEYQPGYSEEQRLLAHELTHVVQQNGGAVMRSPLPQQELPLHTATETPSASVGQKQANGEKIGKVKGTLPVVQRALAQDLVSTAITTAIAGEYHGEISEKEEVRKWKEIGVSVVYESNPLQESNRMPDPPILRAAYLWTFFYHRAAEFWNLVEGGDRNEVLKSNVTMEAHHQLADRLKDELMAVGLGVDTLLDKAYILLDKLVIKLPVSNSALMNLPFWEREFLANSKKNQIEELNSLIYNVHKGGSFSDVSFDEQNLQEERSRNMLQTISEARLKKTIYKVGDDHVNDMRRLKLRHDARVVLLDRPEYLKEYGDLDTFRLVGNQNVFNQIGNDDL